MSYCKAYLAPICANTVCSDVDTLRLKWLILYYAEGHNTLVVSTDPAHSLSDSLDQDVSGGSPVPVEGTDLPVWGMEIDADEARRRFRASSADGKSKSNKVCALVNSKTAFFT